MAAPTDGYNVLEHIDDASSAHALIFVQTLPSISFIGDFSGDVFTDLHPQ